MPLKTFRRFSFPFRFPREQPRDGFSNERNLVRLAQKSVDAFAPCISFNVAGQETDLVVKTALNLYHSTLAVF